MVSLSGLAGGQVRAFVPRSQRRCRPQIRAFNPAGFAFGFGGRGNLLTLAFNPRPLRRRQWNWPRQSGGPSLFDFSFKVQGMILIT